VTAGLQVTGIAKRYGAMPPPGRLRAHFEGSAGQSFGAFLTSGIQLHLVGEANDYVGKAMSGGRIVISPPPDDAGDPCLVGNTALYGATGGKLFCAGSAGERFAVRNSGAFAVVEGVGDHGCEYMTAGTVVVLGEIGLNFGAGMTGGDAFVFDPHGRLGDRLNHDLVAAREPTAELVDAIRVLLERHVRYTGSRRARELLEAWSSRAASFVHVAPRLEAAALPAEDELVRESVA